MISARDNVDTCYLQGYPVGILLLYFGKLQHSVGKIIFQHWIVSFDGLSYLTNEADFYEQENGPFQCEA